MTLQSNSASASAATRALARARGQPVLRNVALILRISNSDNANGDPIARVSSWLAAIIQCLHAPPRRVR